MLTIAGGILIAVVVICIAPAVLTALFWILMSPFLAMWGIVRAVKGDPHKITAEDLNSPDITKGVIQDYMRNYSSISYRNSHQIPKA